MSQRSFTYAMFIALLFGFTIIFCWSMIDSEFEERCNEKCIVQFGDDWEPSVSYSESEIICNCNNTDGDTKVAKRKRYVR